MSAFTQLLDRGVAADGTIAAWCPTMDLLALATADGQLHVHRLNWQRLWWTSPEAPITALEWRPDGKQLAVGLEDGTVMLLNTEDGEVQHRCQLLPDALVAISWTEAEPTAAAAAAAPSQGQPPRAGGLAGSTCGAGSGGAAAGTAASQLSEDRARRMFAPPPPPVPSPAAGLAVGYATCGRHPTQAWAAEPARLAVLACASSAGELALCTSGLFPLARLPLPALLGSPSVSVLRLATAPSLQQLTVCWHDSSEDHSNREGHSSGASRALHLSALSMRHIGCHALQLHRLALAATHVNSLLQGCSLSFQAACKEWQGCMREVGESRGRLVSLMSDYGSSGDPADELQRLLATGAVGGALQQYITVTLGEAGLKKLARAVDAAVCAVHNLLTDHVQTQLEQVAFRLGELRGLALCLPWRSITGLHPDQVGAAEQLALRLVMSAEAVRRRVVHAGAQHRTFFSWLLIIMRRMQEDAADALTGYPRSHLDLVSDFLAGQYRQDVVGPLLGESGIGSSNGSSSIFEGAGAEAGGASPGAAAAGSGRGGSGCGTLQDLLLEVLGRQAPVQAADSAWCVHPASPSRRTSGTSGGGGSSSSGSSGSLGQLLGELQAACAAAFRQTAGLVSPTLQLSGSFSLGPAPCALAAGYLPANSGGTGAGGAAVAVAWEGRQQVLVLRSSGDLGHAAAEAALVQVPGDAAAADVAFYRDGQLALLLAGTGGAPCRLALLPPEQLHFTELPAELLEESDALQLCQMLLESGSGSSSGTQLAEECRQRSLPYPTVQAPMAVSASRGVGCVLAGTQRVLLYDLEEEEEEEEEEGDGEGGEEELVDAHEHADMDSDAYDSPVSR